MVETKKCPVCGNEMGYDFEGSVEWFKCLKCKHKEYLPKKKLGDYTLGEYIALNIYTNKIVYRGTEKECLSYCNDKVFLYVALNKND
jgi:Zn ribbon nucleic-acid-binding protein